MTEEKNPDIWEGTVLTVPNRHVKGCGKPPEITAGKKYTAYFENEYGEQLVFVYDWLKHKGTLWHGDCGWDQPLDVLKGMVPGTIMSAEEQEWLSLVWKVATTPPIEREAINQGGNGSGQLEVEQDEEWGEVDK